MEVTQQSASCVTPGDVVTGNVKPLLHEIRHAMLHWLEKGEVTTIDLRSIPMGPGEEDKIIDELGRGEIQVRMLALGPSEIIETRFPGVWLVTHYNSNEEVIGLFISTGLMLMLGLILRQVIVTRKKSSNYLPAREVL